MRITTTLLITICAAACVGEVGGARKPRDGSGSASGSDGPCDKLEKDVVIRTVADMSTLPTAGCYDIYGKLTVQGSTITTLAGLNGLNSVNELDLDHTGLTAIDTKRPVGIYGKLTVTGNTKLTNLKQLSFEIPATGILIDGNTALTSLDPITLADPALEEVDGDVAITGNTALTSVSLANVTKLTGGLTISANSALKTLDLSKLTTTGHVELSDNAQLASLTSFAATTISGDFVLRNNTVLTTLGTMNALYRVGGNLTIDNNPELTSLAAFSTTVKFVDLMLTITNNQKLTDLGALKHMQLVGAITITGNTNLSVCRAIEIDQCVSHPTTATISNNNQNNCNWQCN